MLLFEFPSGITLAQLDDVSPRGGPAWVTLGLLCETVEVWRPYYREQLDADAAYELLLNVGRLADTMEDAA